MPAQFQEQSVCLGDLLLSADLKRQSIKGLQLDSRQISAGDLFLAVPGLTVDGRDHIETALALGAVAVLAEAEGLVAQHPRVIPVAQLSSKISAIAGNFYGNPSTRLTVTGITGTNGKTTCSYLLAQLQGLLNSKAAMIGTLGFGMFDSDSTVADVALEELGMTTPDALMCQALLARALDGRARTVVMEVSSHSLSQNRVSAVKFDTAIFTNLSRDHLDYHGTMESYAEAKQQLFLQPGLMRAVVNMDDPVSEKIIKNLPAEVQLVSYGLESKADVSIANLQLDENGFSGLIRTPWGEGQCQSQLLGEFNVLNILAVVSAVCSQGQSLDAVLHVLPALQPAMGRMQVVSADFSHAPHVIVDYAHTPDALAAALKALRFHCKGKLWVVFGCGGNRDQGKRPLMGEVASAFADQIIITSDNPRRESSLDIMDDVAKGAKGAQLIENREAAICHAITEAGEQDSILIAGKGHENYQLINDKRMIFSDIECARRVLKQREAANEF